MSRSTYHLPFFYLHTLSNHILKSNLMDLDSPTQSWQAHALILCINFVRHHGFQKIYFDFIVGELHYVTS